MRLMLRARFLAWCHAMYWLGRFSTEHRIWRVYTNWDLKTLAIGCDCGKEFR